MENSSSVRTSMGGKKYDQGKPRCELLPTDALEEVAKVMTAGAKKYGDHNWADGMAWSRLLGAALRHLFAWARGEDKDKETGLSHLAHASCCVLFLLAYGKRGVGEDDRYSVDKVEDGEWVRTGREYEWRGCP